MRFHELAVSGFGPFAGTETIDFDRLGSAGLFLLAGPTGAGKTTLLDAICYALFNETTGEGQGAGVDGRTGADLRCARSSLEQPTMVTLEFSAGGSRYKVERNPGYERARRGGGTTKEAANATLWRRSEAGWEPIASKVREVTERIVAITGFTADQFRRVIVIPQGRFRDVLISSADSREDLLKRIFGTHVFERFEALVDERTRDTQRTRTAVADERRRLLAAQDWAAALDDAAVTNRIVDELERARGDATAAARSLADAAARHETATRNLGAAAEVARAARLLADAERRHATAVARLAGMSVDRDRLAAARAAAEPARLLAARDEADRQHRDAETAAATSRQAADRAAQELAGKQATLHTAERAAADADVLERQVAEIDVRVTEADAARQRHEAAASASRTAADAATAASAALLAARQAEQDARGQLERAEAAWASARRQREAGAAALLAAGLAAGQACPVCGSTEHPAAAAAAGSVPDEQACRTLEERAAAARAALERAAGAAGNAEGRSNAATAEAEAKRAEMATVPAPPDVTQLQGERAGLARSLADLRQAGAAARDALNAATAAAAAAAARADADRERVAPLREAAARAAAAFAAVLAASPFATAEAVGAAALAGATIERIAADLQAAEQEELTARELVSAYGRDLAGRTAPDLAALETAQAEAVAALERCRAADEQVRRQVDDCELLAAAHAAIAARLAAVEADFATASRLQQMVSGTAHAGERMSLHRWVLGAVLEQVVAQATVLLRQMTRGRYELLRSQAAGDRKSLAGLDIDILDVWTGTRRSARTLSGGETFLAALALSLALAKTAEAHQGGRRLETVFIDEGFGSLDAETLEYALTALHSLRDEGRVVGVISHVEEMQRTIPVQLRLLRRGETTTTEIVGLPGP